MIAKIIEGFVSPLKGIKIILSSPKNIGFSLIPFLIGFLVVGVGYFAASEYLNAWVATLTENSTFFEEWAFLKSVVDILLFFISWILVSLLNFLLAYLFIIILAGPFYALMVENIFKIELPDKEPRTSFKLVFGMFLTGLLKALVFVTVGIICFVIAFIPGINFLAPLIMVLLVAFDCMDYAFEVDFLNLRQRFQFFSEHAPYFLGLAGAILVTNLIPGLFFISLPVFICGATQSYIQLQNS